MFKINRICLRNNHPKTAWQAIWDILSTFKRSLHLSRRLSAG